PLRSHLRAAGPQTPQIRLFSPTKDTSRTDVPSFLRATNWFFSRCRTLLRFPSHEGDAQRVGLAQRTSHEMMETESSAIKEIGLKTGTASKQDALTSCGDSWRQTPTTKDASGLISSKAQAIEPERHSPASAIPDHAPAHNGNGDTPPAAQTRGSPADLNGGSAAGKEWSADSTREGAPGRERATPAPARNPDPPQSLGTRTQQSRQEMLLAAQRRAALLMAQQSHGQSNPSSLSLTPHAASSQAAGLPAGGASLGSGEALSSMPAAAAPVRQSSRQSARGAAFDASSPLYSNGGVGGAAALAAQGASSRRDGKSPGPGAAAASGREGRRRQQQQHSESPEMPPPSLPEMDLQEEAQRRQQRDIGRGLMPQDLLVGRSSLDLQHLGGPLAAHQPSQQLSLQRQQQQQQQQLLLQQDQRQQQQRLQLQLQQQQQQQQHQQQQQQQQQLLRQQQQWRRRQEEEERRQAQQRLAPGGP
ncbi:unnamed protein product, partial [Phaeothamnion confervicola]